MAQPFAVVAADPETPTFNPGPLLAEQPSVGEALASNFSNMADVQRLGARDEAWREALWNRNQDIFQRTGVKLPESETMVDPSLSDGDQSFNPLRMNLMTSPPTDAAYEAMVNELRAKHPDQMAGVPDADALKAQLSTRLTGIAANAAAGAEAHPVAGFLGSLAGGMTDPVGLVGMVATEGGSLAAKPFLQRLLVGGAVQAGIWGGLTAAEAPAKTAEAQRIGGPAYTTDDALKDIAMAALGGAVLHAGAESAHAGLNALMTHFIATGAPDIVRGTAQAADRLVLNEQTVGPVRSGADFDAGLQSLDAGRPPPPIEPRKNLDDLFAPNPETAINPGVELPIGDKGGQAAEPPPAGDVVSQIYDKATYRGRDIYAGQFDPAELSAAPELFQYKSGGDDQGVTNRLQGVGQWDQTASGKVLVWEDADGRRFIADGHQRRGLALRQDAAGFPRPGLDGFLFRAADGWSAREVRTIAALKNIREGQGTALDAAKVFRDNPAALADDSLPVSGEFMSQARGLAQLDPDAFKAVVNGVVPERYAAAIGEMAADRPDLHSGLIKLLKEGDPANLGEARALVQEGLLDEWISREGVQTDMFGDLKPEATTIARAKLKAAVVAALGRDSKIFAQLVRHADAIEAGGNALARDANEANLAMTRTAHELVSRLGLRQGPIGEAMAAAARDVVDGVRPGDAAKGIVQRVKNALKDGSAMDLMRETEIAPKPPTEGELKAAESFSDPAGKGQGEQLAAKGEEAEFEKAALAGDLFDDLKPDTRYADAVTRLAGCAPGV